MKNVFRDELVLPYTSASERQSELIGMTSVKLLVDSKKKNAGCSGRRSKESREKLIL